MKEKKACGLMSNERRVERGAVTIFVCLCALVFGLLLLMTLTSTGSNQKLVSYGWEYIYFTQDFLLGNIGILAVLLLAFGGLGLLIDRLGRHINTAFLCSLVCAAAFAVSLYWAAASKAVPNADQGLVCWYASDFNKGDFSMLEKGEYVANCPQQLGIITLLRLLFLLFGDGNYRAFQYFSAAMVPLLICSAWQITKILTDGNKRAECFCLFLLGICFPMYGYVPFVYGEISSTALAMAAVWIFLKCFEHFSWWRVLGIGLTGGLAVQLRRNVLIMLVAFGIIAVVKLLQGNGFPALFMAAGAVLGAFILQLAVDGIYYGRKDPDAAAMPASLYVVMGLNDDNGIPGWYNNYHTETFIACDKDAQLANRKALDDLKFYAGYYRANPSYMADFFWRKVNAQWNAPMYQCRAMTWAAEEPRGDFAWSVYNGRWGKLMEKIMEICQMAVYCSVLILLVSHRKRWAGVEKYVLLITVFGGFLFSVIWEAKSRYVFPYYIMMLPYAAAGLGEMAEGIAFAAGNRLRRRQGKAR